jgi:TRAP-type C4-dicarboxylate transport system permease small subunit
VESTGAPWFTKFCKSIESLSSWFERLGLVAMAAMGMATLIDVIGSKMFQWPLPGSTEITGVLQVVAIAGGLAFSQIDGRQIRVEFLADSLPKRGKAVLDVFGSILGLGLFIIVGWMSYRWGLSFASSGTETLLIGIPLSPFAFWIALSCIPMCCVNMIELLNSIDRMLR